ncbi:hypothetical protein Goshw_012332 [Gossypium schwendimanii]|uniref:Uncharacterized protein n=1 Tax=Gossypium schwendimanii TaxID=34291 RepID=A0A7J9NCG9_GOSSC|nr:hypothetical protein [Gossypium schwendimanii]
MAILHNLQYKDVEWGAPWLIPDKVLYRCRDFDWVPLLRIWRAVKYAPLLVPRQFRSRQFIPAMQGVNDNIPMWNPKAARSLDEYLQVLPSEIEIIKQDFENMKADKLKKGKNKAEEDLDSQNTDYKKLHRSMKTAGLGKKLEQW